ncbi:MAG: hypothetical protein ACI84O_001393, partial [Myxococcota bacterium]
MLHRTKKILLVIAAIYLAIAAILFSLQKSLLYFPTEAVDHPFDSMTIECDDAEINVIVLNAEKSLNKVILYFGGNGEAVAYSATDLANNFPNHVIYLMNYRGYGRSTGHPDEQDIYSDALKVFDSIPLASTRISLIGRSLGSGVA